jgi:hypothetical protein
VNSRDVTGMDAIAKWARNDDDDDDDDDSEWHFENNGGGGCLVGPNRCPSSTAARVSSLGSAAWQMVVLLACFGVQRVEGQAECSNTDLAAQGFTQCADQGGGLCVFTCLLSRVVASVYTHAYMHAHARTHARTQQSMRTRAHMNTHAYMRAWTDACNRERTHARTC